MDGSGILFCLFLSAIECLLPSLLIPPQLALQVRLLKKLMGDMYRAQARKTSEGIPVISPFLQVGYCFCHLRIVSFHVLKHLLLAERIERALLMLPWLSLFDESFAHCFVASLTSFASLLQSLVELVVTMENFKVYDTAEEVRWMPLWR